MGRDGQVATAEMELWDRVFRVDPFGYVLAAKYAIPHLLGRGVIVNMTSGTAIQAELSQTGYATSKAAIIGFTGNVATQYGKQGIRCVALAPGLVATPSLKANMPAAVQGLFLRHHLTTKLAEPEDIAEVVAFVASDRASFITGMTIAVDGGFSAHTPSYV
jgi:NAD(P)-dependent dehydrogenase (short-subunit alcohol dehydrogenase family)